MEQSLWLKGKTLVLREWKTATRFLLVGGSSFAVKAVAYALLSRIFWTAGPRAIENVIAICISMIYNYSFHRIWTFRSHKAANGSFMRYTAVVIIASVLDAVMFYLLHVKAYFYDFAVLVFNAASIALFTFFAHRWFTFHPDPWRRGKKKVDVVQSA